MRPTPATAPSEGMRVRRLRQEGPDIAVVLFTSDRDRRSSLREGRLGKVGPMKRWSSALALLCAALSVNLVGACAATGGPTRSAVPRVGVMHVGTDHNPPSLATLVAGLGGLGWFDGSSAPGVPQAVGGGGGLNGLG